MLRTALITLGDPGRLTGGYLFHKRIAQLAPRHDARLVFVSFPELPFPLAIGAAPRVLHVCQQLDLDALVLDSIAAAFLGPWLSLRPGMLHQPLLGMLHQPPGGIDHGPIRSRLQAVLDRLAYRHARRLLLASASLEVEMRPSIERPERLYVVPPGRDVAPAVQPAGDVRRGRRAALLCVGNWVARKGILDLLEAFAPLPPEAATLHLAGDPRAEPVYGAQVNARLAQPDLRERVVVHGPLSIEAVAGLYAACDVFVLPSRKEPYGTVYGEAMAFGVPVVGWRAGNLPYLAEHGHEGLLVEPGDLAGLTAALRQLIDEPALRQRLGAAARQRALGRPTWDEVAGLFFGHVRQVLDQSSATV